MARSAAVRSVGRDHSQHFAKIEKLAMRDIGDRQVTYQRFEGFDGEAHADHRVRTWPTDRKPFEQQVIQCKV